MEEIEEWESQEKQDRGKKLDRKKEEDCMNKTTPGWRTIEYHK